MCTGISKHVAVWLCVFLAQKESEAKSHTPPVGVESEWAGSGNSCPGRPLNPVFTQLLLIIRASVVVNPCDGLQ